MTGKSPLLQKIILPYWNKSENLLPARWVAWPLFNTGIDASLALKAFGSLPADATPVNSFSSTAS